MSTFVLVHGGCHGGWCWDLVAPGLRERGHRVVAPDLPGDSLDAGLADYRDAVVRALDDGDADRDVVLVGHSFGGVTIPLVAEVVDVSRMVMLCATYPVVGRSYVDAVAEHPQTHFDRAAIVYDADGCVTFPPAAARELFFHDCDDAVTDWALARLRRQAPRPMLGPSLLTRWPDVPLTFVAGRNDRVINGEWAASWTRSLGGDVIELDSGHSPFLSRPAELVEILLAVAARDTDRKATT